MSQKILIIEDDRRIAALVKKNLEAAGFTGHTIYDGAAAFQEIRKFQPSLIIMDIMLPGIDGLELTRRIRKDSNVSILMLTARTAEADKVLGLEIGADDYLTKPFSTLELVARVRALLRRATIGSSAETINCGELQIDPGRRIVEKESKPVELTSLEFDLLYFLASRAGRVYSRESLMEQVWGEDRVVDPRSIDSLISRLRRKLETNPAKPVYLQTVWGAGYRFAE